MKSKYIIIIPAFKPSSELVNLVGGGKQFFKKIVVVDDGSGKQFADKFYEAEKMGCTVLHHYTNLGKGRALKTAFNYCLSLIDEGYQGVITVDADGQHKLEDIIAISAAMAKNKNSLILGARDFSGNDIPFRSKLGNNITRYVFRWLCNIHIRDTQTGLRGIPMQLLNVLLHVEGEKYEYETNVLLKCKEENIEIKEVSIETVYENNNESSHFNPFSDSLKIYQTILKYSFSSLLAAAMDFGIFSILIRNNIKIMYATYIARLCSLAVNFGINRKIVFHADGDFLKQFIKYGILVAVSGTFSGLLVELAASHLGILPILCKIIVETLLYFVNYYVQHTFIFVRKGEEI